MFGMVARKYMAAGAVALSAALLPILVFGQSPGDEFEAGVRGGRAIGRLLCPLIGIGLIVYYAVRAIRARKKDKNNDKH